MAKTSFDLPESMKEQLQELAKRDDRNVAWEIRKAIEMYLASRQEQKE